MQWHQDGTNRREVRIDSFLGLYYPRVVTADMAAHRHRARDAVPQCSDRMATYTNIRGQVPLVVKAGTVAFTHYDI